LLVDQIQVKVYYTSNTAPTDIALDDANIAENAGANAVVGTLSGTDPDAGQSATLIFTLPAGMNDNAAFNISGTSLRANASFNFEADSSYTVTVRATDTGTPGLFREEQFIITVTNVNEAPVVSDILNQTIAEDGVFATISLDDFVADVDTADSAIVWTFSGSTNLNVSITDRVATITAPANWNGAEVINFIATDPGELTHSNAATFTVTAVNDAPVLNPIGPKAGDELTPITFTATASDIDVPANTLTFSLNGAPAGAAIDPATGAFSWTPTEAQSGSATFDVVVSDGTATDTETIIITAFEVNVAPELATIGAKSVDELATLTFTAFATDADLPANILEFSLGGSVWADAVITSGGVFTWTPTEAQGPGPYTFEIIVSDGLAFDSETITVTVNEVNVAPELAAIGNKSVDELAALTFTASAIDADLPANTLTFSLVGAPAGAAITAGGAFTWTPAENQSGSATFTVQVSDGALTDSEEITVTVNEVNVAPVLAAIGNQTVNELVELAFTASATDADLPANTLTFSLSGTVPAGAAIDPATGAFSWTPTEAQSGSATFTVVVSDGTLTDSEEITVTVNEVNVAPVFTHYPDGSGFPELTNWGFAVTATDADVPAQTLTFSLIGAPTGMAINSSNGNLTWIPTEAQGPGTYTFTVRVSDGIVNTDVTGTVDVSEVNVAPVLTTIGDKNVNEQAALGFTVTATDADLPANTLTFSLDAASVAEGMAITSGGVFSWTPTEAQGATIYTVTVTVSDGALTDSETFYVEVNEVNVAPVLGAIGNQNVNEQATLNFTATATDQDDPTQTLTFSLDAASVAAGMSITSGGAFSWTPTEAQGGSVYPVTVTVTDSAGSHLTDTETFNITVAEVNVAPVMTAIANQNVNEQAALTFTATATDQDVPPQPLTFSLDAASVTAGMAITSGGAFSWTPTESQGGSAYPVTVTVSDGALTDSKTFNITVAEVNVAPVLGELPNYIEINEMVEHTFNALATDADLPANTLTFSLVGAPAGAAIDPTTGVFSWTPTEVQGPGDYPFDVVVSDGVLTSSQTVTILVEEVNLPPVLDPVGNKSVDELGTLTFAATSTDPDVPHFSVFWLTNGPAGAFMSPGGNFSWTPTEAQGPGVYTFDVVVNDGLLTDSETITVTVGEVNVTPVLGAIGNKTVDELVELTFTATATDVDVPPNALTFSLSGAPAGAAIDGATGAFSWTPTEAQGPEIYTFDVIVSDGALTDTETITVTVGEVTTAPILGAIGNQAVLWGNELTFTAAATDADLPTQVLTYSLVGAPAGAAIGGATGAFSWTPTSAQIDSFTFKVVVTDNGIPTSSDEETITVTVGKRPTTVIYTGDTSEQYSETATVSATLTDNGGGVFQGAAIAGKTITFTIGTQSADDDTDAAGLALDAITLTQVPGAYTVVTAFAEDALYLGSGDSDDFAIDLKAATVTGITADDKAFNGNDTATLNFAGATLVGIAAGDVVTLDTSAYQAHFNNADMGVDKPVTVTGLALAGADAYKYAFSQPTGLTADITAFQLVIITAPQTFTEDLVSGMVTVQVQDGYGVPVTLSTPLTVNLSTTALTGKFGLNSNGLPVITQVTIFPGTNSTSFYYTDSAPGTPTIAVSSPGMTADTQVETVTAKAAGPDGLVITNAVIPAFTEGGVSGMITVQAVKGSVPTNVTANTVVNLTSTGTTGAFGLNSNGLPVITSVTIFGGTNSTSFYYTNSADGIYTITADGGALGTDDASVTVNAKPAGATKIEFITAEQTIRKGRVSSKITVQLQDEAGNAIKATQNTVVTLTVEAGTLGLNSNGLPVVTQVMIFAGTNSTSFYFKAPSAAMNDITITATVAGLTPDAQDIDVIN
jgi:hypothetical protein